MANRITTAQFNAVKNKEFTIVVFKDEKRIITYAGLSAFGVMNEIMMYTKNADVIVKVIEGRMPASEMSNDIRDYDKYFKGKDFEKL